MSHNTLRLLAIKPEGAGQYSITGAEQYDLNVDEFEEPFDVKKVPYPVVEVKEVMPPEDFEKYYVDGQTLKVRPKFPTGTQKKSDIYADGVDVALFTGLPSPARVIVKSRDPESTVIPMGVFEKEVTDGTLEFVADDADDFVITIIAFPYYQEFIVRAIDEYDNGEEV